MGGDQEGSGTKGPVWPCKTEHYLLFFFEVCFKAVLKLITHALISIRAYF